MATILPGIEKLKSPQLVASIQRYFGVQSIISFQESSKNNLIKSKKHDFKGYTVTNKFWFWLFIFGTGLGDEAFYALFIPFWFWNIDGAVGRRVVLVWGIVMYIGQGIKDIVQWPRPGAPVFRLHNKWELEYGMPSTHAMVGVSIPFSVILYTMHRYQYSVGFCILFAVCWCSVICLSRLYLGMHTVLAVRTRAEHPTKSRKLDESLFQIDNNAFFNSIVDQVSLRHSIKDVATEKDSPPSQF